MVDELPRIIPIFPLPNLVLFPGVSVPLHIFEPRYREMVAEVSERDRIIGMTLLKGDWERDYYQYPDLFGIGCAGRIENLIRLPDGRFNLMLEGIREFRIVKELRDRSFRRASVEWCLVDRKSLELDEETMDALHALLAGYLGDTADEAWRATVEQQALRGADLVNFLCFYLDLSALEKQTLLESLDSRVQCLFDILTFRLEEQKLGPGGSRGGSGTSQ
jgi:uncharacterized protein